MALGALASPQGAAAPRATGKAPRCAPRALPLPLRPLPRWQPTVPARSAAASPARPGTNSRPLLAVFAKDSDSDNEQSITADATSRGSTEALVGAGAGRKVAAGSTAGGCWPEVCLRPPGCACPPTATFDSVCCSQALVRAAAPYAYGAAGLLVGATWWAGTTYTHLSEGLQRVEVAQATQTGDIKQLSSSLTTLTLTLTSSLERLADGQQQLTSRVDTLAAGQQQLVAVLAAIGGALTAAVGAAALAYSRGGRRD